jgi:excisionase family DNA binding protein
MRLKNKPVAPIDRSYQIYALIDPRDKAIRYIGFSFDAQNRLYRHLRGKDNPYKRHWLESLREIGLVPILQVLETIDAGPDAYSTACEREQFWIDKMGRSGAPLLNIAGVSQIYRRPRAGGVRGWLKRREVEAFPMPDEVLTADQVADELKVNIRRVYKWIQERELLATDLGSPARPNYRISRSDLEDFKRRRRTDQRLQVDKDS